MKLNSKIKVCAVLSTLLVTNAFAEFDVPRSIFRIDQLEEAKAKATEKEKPLLFIITDPATK